MPVDTGMQNEIITWTSYDNAGVATVTNLGWLFTPNDLAVVWGRKGAYMPVPIFAKYKTPFQDGALITFLNYAERQIDLTCEMFCSNITILKQRMTAILQAFRPDKPNGVLSVTNEQGITRQLTCHYVDGLKGVEDMDWGAGYVGRFVIILEAGDPFWHDPRQATAQTISVTGGAGNAHFGGNHTYTNTGTMVNAGNVRGWPIWTITCPHSMTYAGSITGTQTYHITVNVTNITTGNHFTVTFTETGVVLLTHTTLNSTDTIRIVDARQGVDAITNGGGTLVPAELAFQNFFPLVEGNNVIQVDVIVPENSLGDNYTFAAGTTTVSMVYQAGFLGL